MIPAFKHLAHARPMRLEAPAQRQGAGCRNSSRLPARGEVFSLDILFYRTKRARLAGDSESLTSKRVGELMWGSQWADVVWPESNRLSAESATFSQ